MSNENEIQQNQIADLLIQENALRRYVNFLDRQLLSIPYLSEKQEVKDLIKERITATKARTANLINVVVDVINKM